MNVIYHLYVDCLQKEFEDIYSNGNIDKIAEISIKVNLLSSSY